MSGPRRINLLPEGAGAERSQRTTKVVVAACLVVLLILLGAAYVMKMNAVTKAKEDLEKQEQVNTSLQNDIGDPELQLVVQKEADLQASVALLAVVLNGEVSFARFLNELSIVLPERVWVTSLTITRTGGIMEGEGGAASGTETPEGITSVTGLGRVEVGGEAECDHDWTAEWLDRIDALGSVESVWASSSAKGECSGVGNATSGPSLTFSSSGTLSQQMATGRSLRVLEGELP